MPGSPEAPEAPARRGGVLLPTLIVLGVIVGAFVIFSGYYSDWLWYQSIDKTGVFTTTILAKVVMFAVFAVSMFIVIVFALWWAYRTRPVFRGMTPEQASLERYRIAIEPYRVRIMLVAAGILALMSGLTGAGEWGALLEWRNATPFGVLDPQFGLDISFYTFALPFIQLVLDYAFTLLLLGLIAAVVVQYLYGGLRLQPKGDRASHGAQVQLSIILALLLFVKSASYWFDRYALMTKNEPLVAGFTGMKYVDVHAVLPSLNILTFVALIVGVLFLFNAFRQSWLIPVLGLGLMFVTSIIVGTLYPMVIQQFTVKPSELVKEQPYLERNITATREAYGVDSVKTTNYPGSVAAPSAQTLADSKGTLQNVRLLDPDVVSPTFNQLQQIRGYYSFAENLDIDRYEIDGQQRGSVVAVREINLAGIPNGQNNWTNERAVFTHGYGMVAAYDNTSTSSGQPDFFEADIPPTGTIKLAEPRVYFGELSPTYSIVGAPKGSTPIELDYPDDASPSGQKTNTYNGTGGVPMGSLFGRLVFATKFQDPNILLSDLVNSDSRVMWDRDPVTRVEKAAPWLTVDQDPYPVAVDGRIKWVIDAYTTSNTYPYSSRVSLSSATSDSSVTRTLPGGLLPQDQLNYMRNSVKAVVDAFDGTVTLYAWEPNDPVLQTWSKVFPGVIAPVSDMSPELMAHVRYPQDIFKVQRSILSRYHVTDASTFYNGTDVWIVPFDPTVSPTQVFQPPYYLTLQMPGQSKPDFSLTTTFAPQRRQTLAAFMAVDSAPGDGYGTIRILQLPSNTTVPGPQQVQNNFESDPMVSSQLSLLRQGGSQVELGNLLSLPFNDGLLYIEPVYLRASADGYPLLRKILVGYGANVAMENTLSAALAKVFGASPTDVPESLPDAGTEEPQAPDSGGAGGVSPSPAPQPSQSTSTDPAVELQIAIAQAQAAYDAGQDALRTGDFTAYGKAMEDLKAALDRAAKAEAQVSGTAGTAA